MYPGKECGVVRFLGEKAADEIKASAHEIGR